MTEAHLDHPGEISWFAGYGPLPVLGACPHVDCLHEMQAVIAWGPSEERYELSRCVVRKRCDGGCRAWNDDQGRITTAWLEVASRELAGSDLGRAS